MIFPQNTHRIVNARLLGVKMMYVHQNDYINMSKGSTRFVLPEGSVEGEVVAGMRTVVEQTDTAERERRVADAGHRLAGRYDAPGRSRQVGCVVVLPDRAAGQDQHAEAGRAGILRLARPADGTPPADVTSWPPDVSTVARRLAIVGSGRTSAERLHIAHAGDRAGAEVHLLVEAVGAEIAGRCADREVAAAGDAGMVAGA